MFKQGLLKQYASTISVFARIMDVALILLIGLFAYSLHVDEWPLGTHYIGMFVRAALLVLLIFPFFGIYRSWRGRSLAHEMRQCTLAWGSVLACLILLTFVTKTSANYSRLWFGLWARPCD